MAATTFTANLDNIDMGVSLYIPEMHPSDANIEYIQKVFHEKNFGWVYRVEFEPSKEDTNLLSAFVYLVWYKTNVVCHLQELIVVPDPRIQAKIFHSNDINYFWVIMKNRNPKILKKLSVSITENEELKKKVSELYEINRKLTKQLDAFKQQGSYDCTKCNVQVENIDGGDIQSETCAKQLCLRCFMDS